jgi:hypothetical protein
MAPEVHTTLKKNHLKWLTFFMPEVECIKLLKVKGIFRKSAGQIPEGHSLNVVESLEHDRVSQLLLLLL